MYCSISNCGQFYDMFCSRKARERQKHSELIQVDGGMLQLVDSSENGSARGVARYHIMLLQMVVILMLEVDLELITLLLESLRMDRLLMYLSCKMQALDLGYMQGVLMP